MSTGPLSVKNNTAQLKELNKKIDDLKQALKQYVDNMKVKLNANNVIIMKTIREHRAMKTFMQERFPEFDKLMQEQAAANTIASMSNFSDDVNVGQLHL
tara:strand:- start:62 stop:358 length:297 start_codon:yes stop_codon:yes gene_type:complete